MRKTKPTSEVPSQPAFCTVEEWMRLSGMRRSATYIALQKGHLRGKKHGRRTLVDVASGMKYLKALPDFRPVAAA